MNKVVARYSDGRIVRGSTGDFSPLKDSFHIAVPGSQERPVTVNLTELKALFFVRDLIGDPRHEERKEFDPEKPVVGRKVRVEFRDGEVLVGTTQAYQPDRPGFFLVPVDRESNNERLYIPRAAVRRVELL